MFPSHCFVFQVGSSYENLTSTFVNVKGNGMGFKSLDLNTAQDAMFNLSGFKDSFMNFTAME